MVMASNQDQMAFQVQRFLIQTTSSFPRLTCGEMFEDQPQERPTLTKNMNPLKEEKEVLQRVLPQKQNKTGLCFG